MDADTLEIRGEPRPLVEGVQVFGGGQALYEVSANGSLVYVAAGVGSRNPVWVGPSGAIEPIPGSTPQALIAPRISSDGTKLALTDVGGIRSYVVVLDLDRGVRSQILSDSQPSSAVWSPDGRRIAYTALGGDVRTQAADGSGASELLLSDGRPWALADWSSDGEHLVLQAPQLDQGWDIWYLQLGSEAKPVPYLTTPAHEIRPRLSPNGRWLAYVSDVGGSNEVYVRPFPDANGGLWPISSGGGDEPIWSSDGKRLFFRDDGRVHAVEVAVEDGFKVGRQELVLDQGGRFQGGFFLTTTGWDISPRDGRMLMMELGDGGAVEPLHMVTNWASEVARVVPKSR